MFRSRLTTRRLPAAGQRLTLLTLAFLAVLPAHGGDLFLGHGPTPSHPFGRLNPSAPPETEQFAFMLGEFDCIDRIRQQDGSWKETPAIWNAAYFLNGSGIQDQYWNETFATSNVRIYDPAAGKWKVTFFKMPGYSSGVWEGNKEGNDMVMKKHITTPDGKEVVASRLTFHSITPDGYKWKGESFQGGKAQPFWTSECTRRR